MSHASLIDRLDGRRIADEPQVDVHAGPCTADRRDTSAKSSTRYFSGISYGLF